MMVYAKRNLKIHVLADGGVTTMLALVIDMAILISIFSFDHFI